MTIAHPGLCDIRNCKNKLAEACVWHHHDNVYCNFNPSTDKDMQRNLNWCKKAIM